MGLAHHYWVRISYEFWFLRFVSHKMFYLDINPNIHLHWKLVVDRPIGKRGPLFVWSAAPLSLRILPSPKASISGSTAKHSSTRLSTLAFCKLAKLDDANAGRMPACVLALRGGRGGVPGGRGGVLKVCRLIVKLGSRPWPHKHYVRTCTHNNS